MKIKEVVETLERFAPLPLQESYDNAGLQVGLTEGEEVSGVLLCLDVTEEVIDEAREKGCNLIVSHHPLLFRPLRHVTLATQVERCVVKAVKSGIAIYAAHTNLDNAPGGVNFVIAQKLGLTNVQFLAPMKGTDGGSGVIGDLPEQLADADFLQKVANAFRVEGLMHNRCSGSHAVKRVALCGGAGDFLLDEAIRQGAQAFLTGEMGYHRYFGHEAEILIAVLGHYQSEQYTVDLLHDILSQGCPGLPLVRTSVNTNPIAFN